ncbi:MAG: hypothetical protein FWF53_01860 [Candidatus Azobacteroides sp.]|nr:hypothetical protein [Candidatus Azobacteroides sp.]
MASKSKIRQQAMRTAARIWELKSGEQLDNLVTLLIEGFSQMIYENENDIEEIKERLLEEIADALTPDSLIVAKPAHSILHAMPLEPELEIDRKSGFYTERLTGAAAKYNLRTLDFSPVIDHIRLVRGEILYLLCERNLYSIGMQGEKELLTRAGVFYQDLNRTVWIGFDLDKAVSSLKDIHFYFDFPLTYHKYDLFSLLNQTVWSIDGLQLKTETGIAQPPEGRKPQGSIFDLYNVLQMNDEEVMNLYRKQFMHINNHVQTSSLKKSPFPEELIPYFPERVKDFEPQYWLKIVFPAHFKKEDLDDLTIHFNAFPVSNKRVLSTSLFDNKNLTNTLPLPVVPGEFFMAVDEVEDSYGDRYAFLPYNITQKPSGGTYTVKRGGLERFGKRDLKEMVDQFVDLLRTEYATFAAMKTDNINNAMEELEIIIKQIKEKTETNLFRVSETPTYLLIDPFEERPNNTISASYWTTNCDLANGIAYGIPFSPLKSLPLEKDSCYLLKAASGGKAVPRKEEMLTAYKYALTTRDQLFSARDIENYCCMKFAEKAERVKVSRGIACSIREKEGLIRTVDVTVEPAPEFTALFDSVTLGELKLELEKRSPDTYRYRILIDNKVIA